MSAEELESVLTSRWRPWQRGDCVERRIRCITLSGQWLRERTPAEADMFFSHLPIPMNAVIDDIAGLVKANVREDLVTIVFLSKDWPALDYPGAMIPRIEEVA